MRTAIIIPTYNRPEYLKRCLDSLQSTYIENGTLIYFTDDASTDAHTKDLISEFKKDGCEIKKVFKDTNTGVYNSFISMYDYCFKNGYEYIINVAPDSIVNNYFWDMMQYYKSIFPENIISGFNTLSISEKGKPRHPVVIDEGWYKKKNTSCSLCFGIDEKIYSEIFRPVITELIQKKKLCYDTISSKKSKGVICTVPSVCEHIGIKSTLNHNFNPDVSVDFEPYIELLDKKQTISVNMATFPKRENEAKLVIKHLITIDMIDTIRVYLNEYNEVPEWCKHDKIEYHIGGDNLKDSGKFFWADEYRNELYYTIDDDLLFNEYFFSEHKKLLNHYDNQIFVSLHGKVINEIPSSFRDLKEQYNCLGDVEHNNWINFPGTGCMVFDLSKYKIPKGLFKYHGMTDLWLSLFTQQNKISCLVRSHSKDELKYILKNNDTLWNQQTEMKEQHTEILRTVTKWKLYKK